MVVERLLLGAEHESPLHAAVPGNEPPFPVPLQRPRCGLSMAHVKPPGVGAGAAQGASPALGPLGSGRRGSSACRKVRRIDSSEVSLTSSNPVAANLLSANADTCAPGMPTGF